MKKTAKKPAAKPRAKKPKPDKGRTESAMGGPPVFVRLYVSRDGVRQYDLIEFLSKELNWTKADVMRYFVFKGIEAEHPGWYSRFTTGIT